MIHIFDELLHKFGQLRNHWAISLIDSKRSRGSLKLKEKHAILFHRGSLKYCVFGFLTASNVLFALRSQFQCLLHHHCNVSNNWWSQNFSRNVLLFVVFVLCLFLSNILWRAFKSVLICRDNFVRPFLNALWIMWSLHDSTLMKSYSPRSQDHSVFHHKIS